MTGPIYLDNGTITRPSDYLTSQMQPFVKRHWQEVDAPYVKGKEPALTITKTRGDLFAFIGAHENDHFQFCASKKEALFHLLHGFYGAYFLENGKNHILLDEEGDVSAHFETLGLCAKNLERNAHGQITKELLEKMLTPKTGLVVLSWADPFTGALHPIWELGELCREKGILVAVDTSHVLGKLYFKFQEMPIDFLLFDGSFIHGPRGSGGLFASRTVAFTPIKTPLNLPSFVGLGIAIEELSESFDSMCMETVRLRDKFEEGIKLAIAEVEIICRDVERLPNVSAIDFPGIKNELLAFHLAERDVFVSFDRKRETLLSFSLSRLTTDEDIDRAIGMISDAAQKCRTFSEELI